MKCSCCLAEDMRIAKRHRWPGICLDGKWKDGNLYVCDNCFERIVEATPGDPE